MSNASTVTDAAKVERGPSGFLRFCAWVSFILNVGIIGTGGAVRLTGSGLGCDDWPLCTPGSLMPTPELSWHSLIEFGNRTISGPILVFAILVFVLSLRLRPRRRGLTVLSALVLGLVLLQAVIGGVIVLLHLNANLVGFHYIVSVLLVCITAVYLLQVYAAPGARERAVPKLFAILTHVMTLLMAVTVLFGVFTTGSGPHSGDANIERDGIDASLMAHIHSWPGYVLLALTLVLAIWAIAKRLRPRGWFTALLIIEIVQVLVGVYQARNGLPPLAVGVHMVLAGLTAASATAVVMRLKKPVVE